MELLEDKVGYAFNDEALLKLALTHSSHVSDHKNNERLEFLGDAVLELVISEYLFGLGCYSEGEMTKLRANIVCGESLSHVAQNIQLGSYLIMGKGEIVTGGRKKRSNLADAFEAMLGAIFLDSDYDTVKALILRLLSKNINSALKGELNNDYKTALQEQIQKQSDSVIEYALVKTVGPEHDKIFHIELKINHEVVAAGKGKSKKEAEQNAAKAYLKELLN